MGDVLHGIKNILRKVINYPTYRISYILSEVGNITNMYTVEFVLNTPPPFFFLALKQCGGGWGYLKRWSKNDL